MNARARTIALTVASLTACAAPAAGGETAAPAIGQAFWDHWGDGHAELAGYTLAVSRYGEVREGVAVTVFVTETFSDALRVKADPGKHATADEFPVLKLNVVEDFQTGIYDYNLMTSTFVALAARHARPPGSTTKVSFSAQEWCGHVYHQVLFDEAGARETLHSYFDGEADHTRTLPHPPGGLAEDALLVWARGLAAPVLAPGEMRAAPVLTSLRAARLGHGEAAWREATLSRSAAPERVTVPAGTFDARVLRAAIQGGPTTTIHVEDAPPHRVLQWERSDGTRAALIAAARMKYWEMNAPGFERALAELGLTTPPSMRRAK